MSSSSLRRGDDARTGGIATQPAQKQMLKEAK
eukprot:CAMPEP_0179464394 /NCGR_PEP_ID=MMETSP0799-20121207/46223_1 /TAXON_ID=46947 /ORGANISM="Geminigera cryophila, Strain CCMP2564" /LENGTH=31 /DNA_ID= /DNA_START= /DNA_END= /DNA_ORIENTATION=